MGGKRRGGARWVRGSGLGPPAAALLLIRQVTSGSLLALSESSIDGVGLTGLLTESALALP